MNGDAFASRREATSIDCGGILGSELRVRNRGREGTVVKLLLREFELLLTMPPLFAGWQ